MTIGELKLILRRNWFKLLLIPLVAASGVYFFLSKKEDVYTSDSIIFTGIASTYRISGDNNDGYKQLKVDMAISDLLIIIKSRETKKEIALSLLAQHLTLPGYDPSIISNENFDRLQLLIPASVREKLKGASFSETLENVTRYCNTGSNNEVSKLIYGDDPIYSMNALAGISVYQLQGSEMVKLEYSSGDPAISQQTLKFLDDIFIQKQRQLFATQPASVIGYFDTAAQKAYSRLQAAEKRLLDFNRANNILDYDQQVTTTSDEKRNSIQKYNDLELQYSGSLATLKELENDLKKKGVSNLESQEIIRLRNQLADVSVQISNLESLGNKSDAETTNKIAKLRQSADELSGKIKQAIDSYYTNTHSSQGVPIKDLVDTYIKNTMLVQQLKSQLDVMRRQNSGVAGEYNKLVPLGSEIRKIKREIELAQQDYLSHTEGLKQSKLTQENLELFSSQMKVLDPPNFPDAPSNQTKLPLLLVAAFLGTFLLTASFIIGVYLLDQSLKNPTVATEIIGMPVISVLPRLKLRNSRRALLLADKAEKQLAKYILLSLNQKPAGSGPMLIGLLSSYSGEGKSFIANAIVKQLDECGVRTLVLVPRGHDQSLEENHTATTYDPIEAITPGSVIPELKSASIMTVEVIIIEFPALLEQTYPVSLLQQLDVALIAIRMGRTWQKSDKLLVEAIKKTTKTSVQVVLTNARREFVREYNGKHKPVPTTTSLSRKEKGKRSKSEEYIVPEGL